MSHECPDCYHACFCGGDIDDMLMNDTPEGRGCDHACNRERDGDCLGCGTCDDCVAHSISHAEEMATEENRS